MKDKYKLVRGDCNGCCFRKNGACSLVDDSFSDLEFDQIILEVGKCFIGYYCYKLIKEE